jgi:hypothetical protein
MLIGQGTSEDEDEPEGGQKAHEEEETPAIPQVMKLDSKEAFQDAMKLEPEVREVEGSPEREPSPEEHFVSAP